MVASEMLFHISIGVSLLQALRKTGLGRSCTRLDGGALLQALTLSISRGPRRRWFSGCGGLVRRVAVRALQAAFWAMVLVPGISGYTSAFAGALIIRTLGLLLLP